MFSIATALVASSLLYLLFMVRLARRPVPVPDDSATDLLYVLVVPCLNEEVVIANSLRSLTALPVDRVRIIVVDDDSSDRTAEIVRTFAPRVELLERRKPNAQTGKGDSLNFAFAHVLATMDRPASKTVFCVMDADGRVEPTMVDVADRYFSDESVGGLQLAVSIRNKRDHLLARMQDFEFLGFCPLVLTAREHLGSATLGGNGQFTRVSQLQALGPAPWSHSLTEDLDLSVRLVLTGSNLRFTAKAQVEQQGLTSIRLLVRQRTRWVQGHFQCWSLIPEVWRSSVSNKAFLDLCYMLLSPGLMLLSSVIFAAAPFLLIWMLSSGPISWDEPALPYFLASVYLLMFGPAMVYGFAYKQQVPEVRTLHALAIAHVSPLYAYLWWVVTWRALFRILKRNNAWAKTQRLQEGNDRPLAPARAISNSRMVPATLGLLAFTSLVGVLTAAVIQSGEPARNPPSAALPSNEDRRESASDSPVEATGERNARTTPTEAESLQLESLSYAGKRFETIPIKGAYVGAPEGTLLRVQRREDDRWVDFPLPAATTDNGRFKAYVELGAGRHQLKISDPRKGATSDVVVLRIA